MIYEYWLAGIEGISNLKKKKIKRGIWKWKSNILYRRN